MATCGDGVRVGFCEQCDDGPANGSAADACRSDCRLPSCGDGTHDSGEECDDGNRASCDGCDEHCRIEPGPVCGDGVRNRACGEECDDGALNSDTSPNACRRDCQVARGDGVVDAGEECDDGNSESCDGCSFDCLVESKLPDADGNGVPDLCDVCVADFPACEPLPLSGATAGERTRFERGRREFLEIETAASGLGPVFNGTRCAECHIEPTVGGSSARAVTRIGAPGSGGIGFDPLVAHGGPVLQSRGLATGTCSVPGETIPPAATFVSERNTPALYGLGLLEAIPELDIRLMADTQRKRKRDTISGHIGMVDGRLGRFGWKAQVATLEEFAADAYLDEIGITTPFHMTENAPQGRDVICDGTPEPEDDGSDVAAFTDFMVLLAPPPPARLDRDGRKGKRIFKKLKCSECHTDKYRTPDNFPVVALRNRKVLAYSDLLLHDMGSGLADGIVQGTSTGSEFRTAPLWGVRFSAPYLHDGRAANLHEAIAAHGGEAQPARDRFMALPEADRNALVAFLKSL
jgi:cysteine-rich repeat protein